MQVKKYEQLPLMSLGNVWEKCFKYENCETLAEKREK
jgi:hypothetical protein